MESVKIILLCILSAVVYGVLHDQVTARVCVEYFTVLHPPVFRTESPTLLALGWGVIATWWVGLLLGIPAAMVSRIGSWPKFDVPRLIRPVCGLMIVMGLMSLAAGLIGYGLANAGALWLLEPFFSRIPAEKHSALIADMWAHVTAYGVGFLGGIVLCGWILIKRGKLAVATAAGLETIGGVPPLGGKAHRTSA